jgi:hypothetical protein
MSRIASSPALLASQAVAARTADRLLMENYNMARRDELTPPGYRRRWHHLRAIALVPRQSIPLQ